MKIIVSHDVDHLYSSDHFFRDLYFPKLWLRSAIYLLRRKYKFSQWLKQIRLTFKKDLHNIFHLVEFEKNLSIKSTFFFSTSNKGRSMSYNSQRIKPFLLHLLNNKFNVGIHGVEHSDFVKMKEEFDEFKAISGLNEFGIRMHYLKYDSATLNKLNDLGYIFDSTLYGIKKPYKIGSMWEIPLCIMEQYVVTNDFEESKKNSIKLLNEARTENLPYFTILFHDHLFSEADYPYMNWFIWFLRYLKNEGYEFITFEEAISELESKKNI